MTDDAEPLANRSFTITAILPRLYRRLTQDPVGATISLQTVGFTPCALGVCESPGLAALVTLQTGIFGSVTCLGSLIKNLFECDGFPGHRLREFARSEAGIKNGSVKGFVIDAMPCFPESPLPHRKRAMEFVSADEGSFQAAKRLTRRSCKASDVTALKAGQCKPAA